MLPANASTLIGLTYFHFVAYNVVSGNYSVQYSPWGEVGSIASVRPGELHFTFFCDMGGYRVHHLITQKVYKIET